MNDFNHQNYYQNDIWSPRVDHSFSCPTFMCFLVFFLLRFTHPAPIVPFFWSDLSVDETVPRKLKPPSLPIAVPIQNFLSIPMIRWTLLLLLQFSWHCWSRAVLFILPTLVVYIQLPWWWWLLSLLYIVIYCPWSRVYALKYFIWDLELSVVCVQIFCFSFSGEKIC